MPGFNGTGPNGMGPMTGGGRGFCSAWGAGSRNYPFPGWAQYGGYRSRAFAPRMSREQELEFLEGQAKALKNELNQLEIRIEKLSAEQR